MTVYQSIFQKRTRPVTERDFEDAAPLQIFSEYTKLNHDVGENVKKWNERIPFLPQDVFTLFHSSFKNSAHLQVVFDARYDCINQNSVFFNLTDSFGNRFARLNFHGGIQTPTTEITVKEENRGQGIGKKWFLFANELCMTLGHHKRDFCAGASNGGYTWARAGAHIDLSPSKHTALTHLREKLLNRLDVVRPFIPPDVYNRTRPLCRVVSKDDLTRIAEIDFTLPRTLCTEMEDLRDNDFKAALSSVFNKCGSHTVSAERDGASKIAQYARVKGVPFKLGRYLLSRTVWDAYIDFSDAQQMSRVGDYVGGWKTIVPTDKKTPAVTPAFLHS